MMAELVLGAVVDSKSLTNTKDRRHTVRSSKGLCHWRCGSGDCSPNRHLLRLSAELLGDLFGELCQLRRHRVAHCGPTIPQHERLEDVQREQADGRENLHLWGALGLDHGE
jgi:hypothetical protein